MGITESESKRSESGEGFEILDDTEIAEVKGLGFEVSLNQVRDSEGDLII